MWLGATIFCLRLFAQPAANAKLQVCLRISCFNSSNSRITLFLKPLCDRSDPAFPNEKHVCSIKWLLLICLKASLTNSHVTCDPLPTLWSLVFGGWTRRAGAIFSTRKKSVPCSSLALLSSATTAGATRRRGPAWPDSPPTQL